MLATFVSILSFAFTAHLPPVGTRGEGGTQDAVVRVALGAGAHEVSIAAAGTWRLEDAWGRVHARGRPGE